MAEKRTMTIPEAGLHYLGLGRGGSYLAAKRGDLPLIGRGKHKRVSVPAMEARLLEAGKTAKRLKQGVAGIVSFSSDVTDKRVLRVHFDHDTTDDDRAELLAAVNQFLGH